MELVDKQNDLALRVRHLFQKCFQAIFEFAAKLRAGDHRANVHGDDTFLFQRVRHVAANDASRKTFHDCRFANTWIADQHRVVFRAPREHLHDSADLIVAADYRVDFPAPRQFGKIAPVFLKRLIFALRILIGHTL